MERPKSSRNKSGGKENDINLKVFCLTPRATSSEERDTSVYEIDIQSDFEFYGGKIKGKETPVGVSISKISYKDSENNRKEAKDREHTNPFIQAYYPNFLQKHSDENALKSESHNPKSRTDIVREKSETIVEKADKENQAPSMHSNIRLQKHIKSFIIENFFDKNKSDLKTMFQDYENKLDTNELHLHHHEHHHHYYFDSSFLSDSSRPSGSRREYGRRKKNRESAAHEEKMFENINRTTDYVCQVASNTTFTHVRVVPNESSDPRVDADRSLERVSSFPIKSSVSVESVLRKKSDFIKSHVYSDSDFTKSENQDEEVFVRDNKKNSKSNFSMLVNSLKNLNQLKKPLIITDQQTVPKFSYITCECTSVDTMEKMSSISLFNSDHLGEMDETERTTCESEDSIKDTGARKIKLKKPPRKIYFEVWKAKLKTELRQIREELQRFEELHFKKRDSSSSQPRSETEVSESGPDHKITVYSSKTFIMGPENLSLGTKCDFKEFENGTGFLVKENKLAYEESVLNTLPLRPIERKAKRKRIFRKVRTGLLQRV